jgi:redox-sensitive bicupin YhaK (pirin superfamily)
MITLRPSRERGYANHGWLETRFSFSFADYYDPAHMGFRVLRVLNDDLIEAETGFGPHPHRDMEIVTWLLEGAVEHHDSLGRGGVLRPGDAQVMSAGTGIRHSEVNPGGFGRTRLFQLWIEPRAHGLKPAYGQTHVPASERQDRLRAVASHDGRDGSLVIQQDAVVYAALLAAGRTLTHDFAPGRHAWVQVATGGLTINGVALQAGDGCAISAESAAVISATADAEFLFIDLP